MNWSKKMWALQKKDGSLTEDYPSSDTPRLLRSRFDARWLKGNYHPTTKVVRVQVDVKVIE